MARSLRRRARLGFTNCPGGTSMRGVVLGCGTAGTHQSSAGQSCWRAQVRRRPRSASVSCVCAALALLVGSPTAAQPPTLELLSTLEGPANLVAVDGDYAYVSADNELRVVDLSEPTRPAVRGSLSVIGRIYFIYVVDQTVYLASGLDGLHIVDVSNPSSPRPPPTSRDCFPPTRRQGRRSTSRSLGRRL